MCCAWLQNGPAASVSDGNELWVNSSRNKKKAVNINPQSGAQAPLRVMGDSNIIKIIVGESKAMGERWWSLLSDLSPGSTRVHVGYLSHPTSLSKVMVRLPGTGHRIHQE